MVVSGVHSHSAEQHGLQINGGVLQERCDLFIHLQGPPHGPRRSLGPFQLRVWMIGFLVQEEAIDEFQHLAPEFVLLRIGASSALAYETPVLFEPRLSVDFRIEGTIRVVSEELVTLFDVPGGMNSEALDGGVVRLGDVRTARVVDPAVQGEEPFAAARTAAHAHFIGREYGETGHGAAGSPSEISHVQLAALFITVLLMPLADDLLRLVVGLTLAAVQVIQGLEVPGRQSSDCGAELLDMFLECFEPQLWLDDQEGSLADDPSAPSDVV